MLDRIKKLIAGYKIEETLDELEKCATSINSSLYYEILFQKSIFQKIKKEKRLGINVNSATEEAKLIYNLIEILKDLETSNLINNRVLLSITIKDEIQNYNKQKIDDFKHKLSSLLDVDVEDIKVETISIGSINILFNLPKKEGIRLKYDFDEGRTNTINVLSKFNVIKIDFENKLLYWLMIFMGDSNQVKQIVETINRVSPTNARILINGQTGSGKRHVSQIIHLQSDRRFENFIEVDCKLMNDNIEEELFGVEENEIIRKIGKIELANNGTQDSRRTQIYSGHLHSY